MMPTSPVIFSLRALLIVVLACSGATGCASSKRPATPPPPAPSPAQPAAAETLPDSLKWVQRSAEYHAAVIQTYRIATAAVERHASASGGRAWAVVLDADETVISNLQYQIERSRLGAAFSAESWAAWVRRREAVPLPGAAAFLARVRALGGRIAIVTNRLQSECDDTIALFRAHALAFDAMLCRADGSPSDKNPRFAAVAAGRTPAGPAPIEVAAFVGDNIQDFPTLTQATREKGEAAFSDFGVRFFLVPNPMYGGWQ
jgi:5'-nucleotidase (lipoprotein e(P4) family)